MEWGRGAETDLMPSLIDGNTELSVRQPIHCKGLWEPNSELFPNPSMSG